MGGETATHAVDREPRASEGSPHRSVVEQAAVVHFDKVIYASCPTDQEVEVEDRPAAATTGCVHPDHGRPRGTLRPVVDPPRPKRSRRDEWLDHHDPTRRRVASKAVYDPAQLLR